MRPALLVGGPTRIDYLDDGRALVGGDGAVAAAAAAACLPTQLWSRGGSDWPESCRQACERRRIDTSGLLGTGPCSHLRLSSGKGDGSGSALPEEEPHDPELLAGILLTGLDPLELSRGLSVAARLRQRAPTCQLIVSLNAACLATSALRHEAAQAADVLIARAEACSRALGAPDPLSAAQALAGDTTRIVALTAGELGGLVLYKKMVRTWPADPVPAKDERYAHAAFVGAFTGLLLEGNKHDLSTCQRAAATAGAVAQAVVRDHGSRGAFAHDRAGYQELFHRLRRVGRL